MKLETVRIVADEAPGGYVVINKTDLTDDHVLFEEPTLGHSDKHTELSDADKAVITANSIAVTAIIDGTVDARSLVGADLTATTITAGTIASSDQNFIDPHAKFDDSTPVPNDDKPLTVAQLKDALTGKGIDFPAKATRAELLALLPE